MNIPRKITYPPITPKQRDAICKTEGISTRAVDQLESRALIGTQAQAKLRTGELLDLRGDNLEWTPNANPPHVGFVRLVHRNGMVYRKALGEHGFDLAQHILRLPFTAWSLDGKPILGNELVFRNMKTGERLSEMSYGHHLKKVGWTYGIENLNGRRVRRLLDDTAGGGPMRGTARRQIFRPQAICSRCRGALP